MHLNSDPTMPIQDFAALREKARAVGPRRVAVVAADDDVALAAVAAARAAGIATAVLVGEETRITRRLEGMGEEGRALAAGSVFVQAEGAEEAARVAVQLVRAGKADVLLKGHVRTDQLLRAVLDREHGLRTGRLLSDVLLYEDVLSGVRRLVGVTDGGINVAPSLEQKKQIVENGVAVLHALGFEQPCVAIMSATEAVSPSVPSTVDAQELTRMAAAGEITGCRVYGPLALDNALLESAARAKGIDSPVAGHADLMVVPTLEAGNLLGKAVKYLGGSQCAHVVVGASAPVLIPSRVESVDDKLNSIALGVVAHAC